jgi:NTE family protein
VGEDLDLRSITRVLFSGGGVRGIAYAGALSVLWSEKTIDWGQRCPPLESVGGCSIGALYAFLICLGYSASEIEDIAKKCKPDSFVSMDFTRVFPGRQVSLDSGECAKQLLVDWLMKKCTDIQSREQALKYSLKDLKEKKKTELRIYVTHLNSRQVERANENNSVISSLLASMALPPLYASVALLGERKGALTLAQYADGGLANFYPLLFEEPGTLGFRLLQKPFTMDQVLKTSRPFLSYLTLALDIAVSEKEEYQWQKLNSEQQKLTVTIVCGTELGSMDLSIADADHALVLQAGKKAMRSFCGCV